MKQDSQRRCCNDACTERVNSWRQCPDKDCATEIAFCKPHGGDERAQKEMKVHVGERHRYT